ncbi:MAG: serine O-acetyltransferase [Oscillospiraceae bacterium]|nr:serine O-acetyltransferase [Oscillospiraceae bacterium]MBR3611355.1 serine O-acetyltransferase [Oscillospiraceae bacterium]
MFSGLRKDINAVKERDPAAPSSFKILLMYSGLHAIMWHRPAYWLWHHGFRFTARALSQIVRFFTGVEIHPAAKLGRGILIDHGAGVVIGETAEVGDGCTIYQGVTLGGTGKETGKRHPTLEKNVIVGCGAKVLGPFTVGEGAKIAANAVVLNAIPEYSTAVGVPARVVRQHGKKVVPAEKLDQVHIPDPVSQEICKLYMEIDRLKAELAEMKSEASLVKGRGTVEDGGGIPSEING